LSDADDVRFQSSKATQFHFEGGLLADVEFQTCKGLGLEVCDNLLSIHTHVSGYFDLTRSSTQSSEHTSSATLSYSFDYTTSDDIEKAGNRSDMFLTPSLNVKFSKSADITFNKATCSAAYKEIVTWSLDSESNVPVYF
jgi:hypothetical protein